ncbi:MAG: pyridoxamine 5'-phosphate oxidase family protein [Chloroflexota bacterium]|nr:pyridoxamine 5'-phosphate oxidase family protein [Chloroflexota bacterium]MDQ3150153.1 pyridoxamine 5'-phosphate oxidase family protein [Chloroflexota bacterium]
MTAPLSANALAFLDEVMPVFIGTTRSDGTVQMNPIWYELRDDEVWLNAATSRAWGKRLEAGAPLTLLFVDPADQWRWAQVQGEVIAKSAEEGEEHIDRLSRRYLGRDYAFHDANDPRLVIRVRPTRVTGSIDERAA